MIQCLIFTFHLMFYRWAFKKVWTESFTSHCNFISYYCFCGFLWRMNHFNLMYSCDAILLKTLNKRTHCISDARLWIHIWQMNSAIVVPWHLADHDSKIHLFNETNKCDSIYKCCSNSNFKNLSSPGSSF